MASFSGLGIGLSLVFGCLLLALVAEMYYVLWWKKRVTTRHTREFEDDYSNYAKELIQLFCWKKPSSLQIRDPVPINARHEEVQPDPELGGSTTTANKDLFLKAFGDESEVSELMRLHNLAGPPRFLFTIKEETMEDLESDDGKSRGDRSSRKGSRTRSLSDLILTVDSPTLKSPLAAYHQHHGFNFNPLFESSSSAAAEANLHRLRSSSSCSSPPPKFKFLRDAEEKLLRKLMEETEKRVQDCSTMPPEVREGSFLKFIVGQHHHPSTSSQVLPLASSPSTTFRPLDDNQKPKSPLEW